MKSIILLAVEMPPLGDKPEQRKIYNDLSYSRSVAYLRELSSKDTSVQLLGDNVLLFLKSATLDKFSEVCRNLSEVPYKYTDVSSEELRWTEVARKVFVQA